MKRLMKRLMMGVVTLLVAVMFLSVLTAAGAEAPRSVQGAGGEMWTGNPPVWLPGATNGGLLATDCVEVGSACGKQSGLGAPSASTWFVFGVTFPWQAMSKPFALLLTGIALMACGLRRKTQLEAGPRGDRIVGGPTAYGKRTGLWRARPKPVGAA